MVVRFPLLHHLGVPDDVVVGHTRSTKELGIVEHNVDRVRIVREKKKHRLMQPDMPAEGRLLDHSSVGQCACSMTRSRCVGGVQPAGLTTSNVVPRLLSLAACARTFLMFAS
jgi:hypothetical protein